MGSDRRLGVPRGVWSRLLTLCVVVTLVASLSAPTVAGADDPEDPPSGSAYAAEVLSDDPLVYFRLDDNGVQAVDSSGFGHHGVIDASTDVGVDGALLADENAAIESIGEGPAVGLPLLELPEGFVRASVEVWALSGEESQGEALFRLGNALEVTVTGAQSVDVRYGSGVGDVASVVLPNGFWDEAWHHWVASHDGEGALELFFDGQRVARVGSVPAVPAGPVSVDVGSAPGLYDEFAIYADGPLDPERVRAHWVRGRSTSEDLCPEVESTSYTDAVLDDEPVAYYRLGELENDPGSQVAFDVSGNCRTATLASNLEPVEGPVVDDEDDAAIRDPVDGRWAMVAPSYELPTGADPFSIEMWLNPDADWTSRSIVQVGDEFKVSLGLPHNLDGGLVAQTGRRIELAVPTFTAQGAPTVVTRFVDVPYWLRDGNWHHLVLAYDGSTLDVYADRRLLDSVTNLMLRVESDAGPVRLGSAVGGYDEVAIYDTGLSTDRVFAHWDAARPGDPGACRTPEPSEYVDGVLALNPAAYLRLGERSVQSDAAVAYDSSGNCRNGIYEPSAEGAVEGALLEDDDGGVVTGDGAIWSVSVPGSWPTVEFWSRGPETPVEHYLLGKVLYGAPAGSPIPGTSTLRVAANGQVQVLSLSFPTSSWVPYSLPGEYFDGEWHHWVLSGSTLYFDGQLVATVTPISSLLSGFETALGGGPSAVDEFVAYSGTITASQVLARYEAGRKYVTTTELALPQGGPIGSEFEVTATVAAVSEGVGTPSGEVTLWASAIPPPGLSGILCIRRDLRVGGAASWAGEDCARVGRGFG